MTNEIEPQSDEPKNAGHTDDGPQTESQKEQPVENSVDTQTAPPESEPTIEPVNPIEAPYGLKADGTPAKKRGRKPVGEQAERLSSVTPAPPRVKAQVPFTGSVKSTAIPTAIPTDYDAMGKTAAGLWFGCGEMIFGNDWAPDVARDEHVLVKNAFKDYFQSTNATQLSPGLVLTVTLLSYAAVRVQKPTVKDRLNGITLWIKNKLPKRFAR